MYPIHKGKILRGAKNEKGKDGKDVKDGKYRKNWCNREDRRDKRGREKTYDKKELAKRIAAVLLVLLALVGMLVIGARNRSFTLGGALLGRGWLSAYSRGALTGKADGWRDKGRAGQRDRQWCVVLDAGHGGADPGKVGINSALEKDINLRIAYRVKAYLEASDVMVYMTRKEDEGLYENEDANKKVRDMQKRIAIIEEHKPDICVSIHQNSFPDSGIKGAQVFYYTGSKAGKTLAESVQKQLREVLDPTNKRQVKADDSYYLLKKTAVPLVIVECGFLSNPTEAAKLCEEAYQDRVAWAIHIGIMRYLNT